MAPVVSCTASFNGLNRRGQGFGLGGAVIVDPAAFGCNASMNECVHGFIALFLVFTIVHSEGKKKTHTHTHRSCDFSRAPFWVPGEIFGILVGPKMR